MTLVLIPSIMNGISNAPFAGLFKYLIGYHDGNGILHNSIYQNILPMANIGFGWVIPGIIGFIIGLVSYKVKDFSSHLFSDIKK